MSDLSSPHAIMYDCHTLMFLLHKVSCLMHFRIVYSCKLIDPQKYITLSALYTPQNAFLLSSWIINIPFTIVGDNEMQNTLQSIILLAISLEVTLQTYTTYSEIQLTSSAYH